MTLNRFCPLCGKTWVIQDTGREGCETFICPNYHALEKENRTVPMGYRTTKGRLAGGHVITTKRQWKSDQGELLRKLRKQGLVPSTTSERPKDWLTPRERCAFVDEDGDRCPENALPLAKRIKLCATHRVLRTRQLTAVRTKRWRERKKVTQK